MGEAASAFLAFTSRDKRKEGMDMRSFRFIHAADLHLDCPFKGLTGLPERLRSDIRDSTFAALDRLVELALRERVHFVLFAGDIYEAKDRSLRAQLRFQQALEALAAEGIPAFIIHGNHDPLLEGYTAKLRLPGGVRVFGCEAVESALVYAEDGQPLARISGISFDRAAVTDNLTPGYANWGDGLFHIGLLHTNVDGDGEHGNYAPCRLADLLGRGVDYWALGHIHTRRILHERPWVVYPGNVQGRHIRETGARGCYVVRVSEQGEAEPTFHALDVWRWEEGEVPIEGLDSEQQLKEALEDALFAARERSEGRSAIVRLTLTGRGPMHAVLRRAGALAELASMLREQAGDSWLESLTDRTGAPVDPEKLAAQSGFLGELLRLSRETAGDRERFDVFAKEALGPLAAHPALASMWTDCTEEERQAMMKEAEELAIDLLASGAETGWNG